MPSPGAALASRAPKAHAGEGHPTLPRAWASVCREIISTCNFANGTVVGQAAWILLLTV